MLLETGFLKLFSIIIFGDFPHENSNIFAKIFYDYFGGKSVFSDFRKNRIPDSDFFCLKPPRDQDGAIKKRLSQIGPAVPEL